MSGCVFCRFLGTISCAKKLRSGTVVEAHFVHVHVQLSSNGDVSVVGIMVGVTGTPPLAVTGVPLAVSLAVTGVSLAVSLAVTGISLAVLVLTVTIKGSSHVLIVLAVYGTLEAAKGVLMAVKSIARVYMY